MDSLTSETYRELLASERLDLDPMERLIHTMQLGFSAIMSQLATTAAGEVVQIPPSMFDPTAKAAQKSDAQVVGPNQMAQALGGYVS